MKKINTIKKYREFKEILNLRHFKRNDLFCVYFRDNSCDHTRVGLLVTKRNGNAVTRVKIKRQTRSIVDSVFDYKKAMDVIIVINKKYDVNEFEKNKIALTSILTSLLGEKNEN